MPRRSWLGYHPAAVEAEREAAYEAFEAELTRLQTEEVAVRERLSRLRAEEAALSQALSQVEQAEESLRASLTESIARESVQLQAVTEAHAREIAQYEARITNLQQERERIARVEAALVTAVRGALAQHTLQEVDRP
jgi:predicted nuclease with TOPRIM domain